MYPLTALSEGVTERGHVSVPSEPESLLQQQPILNDDDGGEVVSDAAVQMSAGEVLEL